MAPDRIDGSVELLEEGLDYACFDGLAERTIAHAHRRIEAGGKGYSSFWIRRLREVVEPAAEHGTTLITNSGAADPVGLAEESAAVAAEAGVSAHVTAVTGDDCYDLVAARADELGVELEAVISANAYTGAEELLGALETDHDADCHIIVGGRLADPSMYVAPLVHEFDWDLDDWERLGRATALGHVMECGGQMTGGYFMEAGRKPVDEPHRLGFPYAEVDASGEAVLQKPAGSGGRIDRHTILEQLYYEIHDPSAYLTPDVSADFTGITLEQVGDDRVRFTGATGTERPENFKVLLGTDEGYRTEYYIAYGAPNAIGRAEQTAELLETRLRDTLGYTDVEIRTNLVGVDALYGDESSHTVEDPPEVELRVAVACPTREVAEDAWLEGVALWPLGPAAGGGFHPQSMDAAIERVIGSESCLHPREEIAAQTEYMQFDQHHEPIAH